MELRDLMLLVHIASAGTWLGANMVQMATPPLALAQGPETAAGWMRISAGLMRRLYMPASVLLLASGVGLVVNSPVYGFADLFVTIGFTVIIIGAVLGMVVFGPAAERAARAIESGDAPTFKAATGRIARFGALDTVLVLVAITAMILRLN